MASSFPTLSTTIDSHPVAMYKGKVTRSWQHLPQEIIRLITTYYLLNVASTNYCPNTWEVREKWPGRIVYTLLRDALDIERLMSLFPAWKQIITTVTLVDHVPAFLGVRVADFISHITRMSSYEVWRLVQPLVSLLSLYSSSFEHHYFWHHACAVIDPLDIMKEHSVIKTSLAGSTQATEIRLSPYQHFHNMMMCSCAVCRINSPNSGIGLLMAKRQVSTAVLGGIMSCKTHRKNSFCGVCLREAPQGETDDAYSLVCCVENEDDETWPGVEATCRSCRAEWLWRRVQNSQIDREAVGGSKFQCSDWETRQTLESFIDVGEGSIGDVISLARERHWLRQNTKLPDMLQQALAASRYASRAEAGEASYASEEELSEEDDDDPDLMSMTEDAGGVREIAINDWARNRILDGHWISPADSWYNYSNMGRPLIVPAHHPCPWHRGATYGAPWKTAKGMSSILVRRPSRLWQLREILLPAMNNVVRRLVIECTADGVDPAMKAARMTPEDVAQELRDESSWFNGIDWLERRANVREAHEQEQRRRRAKDEDDSSSSSRSEDSHTTSPVLSTTTLQTTPSPPPSGSVSAKDEESVSSPTTITPVIPIPVSPVLKSPELLHPIPYIPVTTSHLPFYSIEAFNGVWREACAPLYHCRCSICERAVLKANLAAGNIVPTQAQLVAEAQHAVKPLKKKRKRMEEEEEEEEGESEQGDDTSIPESITDPLVFPVTPRKRPSRELDDDAYSDVYWKNDAEKGQVDLSNRGGTPPKRARREGSYSPTTAVSPTPVRSRKRSSEELEDDDVPSIHSGNGDSKRPRGLRDHRDAIVAQNPSSTSVVKAG
ncbi:hypothetical protein A0H81_14130 [Grifola frondosa]|uniref:Uncharacterized protein n=1 Tax=Grifola frondosa TaxID=5627 RepID=A0A1C7LMV0_GRIFR|nr:hypothetical protein A0H81_14130 [Grifola frondosa]